MKAEREATEPVREPAVAGQRWLHSAHRPSLIELQVAGSVISVPHLAQRVRHENIVDLLLQFWRGGQPASNTQAAVMPKTGINPAWPILSASCRLRSRPVPQQLGVITSLGLFAKLDACIMHEFYHHVVVDVLATRIVN